MAKKKKRMSKEELRSPDRFEVAMESAWKKLAPYKTPIIVGLVALIAVGIGVSVWSSMQASAEADRAEELRTAITPLTAPIWKESDADPSDPNAPKKPRGESFETRDAALEAAKERLNAYLEANPDGEAAATLKLALASVRTVTGSPKDAAEALSQWVEAHGDGPLGDAALNYLAEAQLSAGQVEAARATYQKLAERTAGMAKAMALVAVGDLYNPLMVDSGDAGKARESYEAAEKLLGPEPAGDNPLLALQQPYLRGELETRLKTLP